MNPRVPLQGPLGLVIWLAACTSDHKLTITDVVTDGTRVRVEYAIEGDNTEKLIPTWKAGDGSGLATAILGDAGALEPAHSYALEWNAAMDVPGDRMGAVELLLNLGDERASTGPLSLEPRITEGALATASGVRRLKLTGDGERVSVTWSTEDDPPGVFAAAGTPAGGMAWVRALGGTADPRWNPASVLVDDGVVVVWQDYRNEDAADLYAARLDRDGVASPELRVDAAATVYNSMDPVMTYGPAGVVAAWTDNREDDQTLRYQAWSSVYVAVSVDNGRQWSANDVRVDTGSFLEGVSFAPVVAQDDSGRVYVAWLDSRAGGYQIRLNRSDDGGASWLSEDVLVADGINQELRMLSAGDGQLVLCWEDWNEGLPNVVYAASLDAGASFTTPTRLNQDAGPARRPAMAVYGEEVTIAWMDQSNGAPDIHVGRSLDAGLSFDELALGDDAPGAAASANPTVAYDLAGHLAVAWLDAASGDYLPMMVMMINDGWTAAVPLREGDAASELQAVGAGDAGWYFVWREAGADYGLPGSGFQASVEL